MEGIIIKNLKKAYKNASVYDNFSLEIEKNKITAILGESGSGKTTLLNSIAGLTEYAGEIEKSGVISYIFQEDRLIPNLTVKENLELVLKGQDVSLLLEKVGLKGFENAYIKNMSAGEKRRVAILRGIFYPSDILLMDEPFINLDLKLKLNLIELIKNEQLKKPRTVVFVTHDIIEAANFSNRTIVLKKGKAVFDKTLNSSIEEKAGMLYSFLKNV